MKEERKELYEKLANNWSALFKLKVGDLFTREELAQEVWLALLQAEESDSYDEEKEASLETYLGSCIKNHLYKKIQEEVYHTSALGQAEDEEIEDLFADKPEDVVIAEDLYREMKVRVWNLCRKEGDPRSKPFKERGLFVLERMSMTDQEISDEAHAVGLAYMSRPMVQIIKTRIRDEVEKMLEE